MAYFIWLYVVPTIIMLLGMANEYRRSAKNDMYERLTKGDVAACFCPGFNLICSGLGVLLILLTLVTDPMYFIRTWKAK